ncbi:MAG: hypothetical protein DWQ10_03050 [Calditrichaeota bacterium]|nr:MAG: hypothetical protein DWQ10_03050 [Calditrichota bacterium]
MRDRDAYVMILLEFQSRVDYFMSLRILNYVTNFYMDYVQNNTKLRKLPALFPIMLYNGNSKWRAPTKITELIENGQLPGKHQIRFEYFKIAENEYSKQKLLKMRNLVSTLFLAETHYDIELLKDEFVKLFEREEDKSSISLILNWFLQLKRFGRIEEKDYKAFERVYKEKEEVHEMLITALKKEKEEYFRQGKAEGKEEEKALRNQEIAKVLLRLGHDVKTIQQMTKLLVQEIEALKKMLEE